MSNPAKSTPKDAQVMSSILKDMGVTDYEPRVINQMLECTYRYVTDVLDDAKVYSSHGGKKNIDVEDIKLAVRCRMDHSFTTPPPRDLLMDIARHRNNQSLPLIKPYAGPKLPPDRYCLSSQNYKLRSLKKPRVQLGLPGQLLQSTLTPKITTANRFPVNINTGGTLQLVTRGVSSPTVTFVTKSSSSTSAVPTPTIKFNAAPAHISMGAAPVTVMQDSFSGGGDSSNSLKRKHTEEDDDYDS